MENFDLLKWAKEFGVFAALFVGLFIWVLRTSAKREDKLMTALDKLAERFGVVDDIKQTVERIEGFMVGRAHGTNGGK